MHDYRDGDSVNAKNKTKKTSGKLNYPILISGFIGSGKSTLAKRLAKQFGLKYVSASELHRGLVLERLKEEAKHAKKIQKGFWESDAGKKGMKIRSTNFEIDKEVDVRLLKQLKKNPHCVTDARLMPWLYKKKALRIWLTASEKERSARVGLRDDISSAHARTAIRSRMKMDQAIWKNLYGIKMGKDLEPFDLVLNNEKFSAEETFAVVRAFIDGKILRSY